MEIDLTKQYFILCLHVSDQCFHQDIEQQTKVSALDQMKNKAQLQGQNFPYLNVSTL